MERRMEGREKYTLKQMYLLILYIKLIFLFTVCTAKCTSCNENNHSLLQHAVL